MTPENDFDTLDQVIFHSNLARLIAIIFCYMATALFYKYIAV